MSGAPTMAGPHGAWRSFPRQRNLHGTGGRPGTCESRRALDGVPARPSASGTRSYSASPPRSALGLRPTTHSLRNESARTRYRVLDASTRRTVPHRKARTGARPKVVVSARGHAGTRAPALKEEGRLAASGSLEWRPADRPGAGVFGQGRRPQSWGPRRSPSTVLQIPAVQTAIGFPTLRSRDPHSSQTLAPDGG
jgi:hypothetical protein